RRATRPADSEAAVTYEAARADHGRASAARIEGAEPADRDLYARVGPDDSETRSGHATRPRRRHRAPDALHDERDGGHGPHQGGHDLRETAAVAGGAGQPLLQHAVHDSFGGGRLPG